MKVFHEYHLSTKHYFSFIVVNKNIFYALQEFLKAIFISNIFIIIKFCHELFC